MHINIVIQFEYTHTIRLCNARRVSTSRMIRPLRRSAMRIQHRQPRGLVPAPQPSRKSDSCVTDSSRGFAHRSFRYGPGRDVCIEMSDYSIACLGTRPSEHRTTSQVSEPRMAVRWSSRAASRRTRRRIAANSAPWQYVELTQCSQYRTLVSASRRAEALASPERSEQHPPLADVSPYE